MIYIDCHKRKNQLILFSAYDPDGYAVHPKSDCHCHDSSEYRVWYLLISWGSQ